MTFGMDNKCVVLGVSFNCIYIDLCCKFDVCCPFWSQFVRTRSKHNNSIYDIWNKKEDFESGNIQSFECNSRIGNNMYFQLFDCWFNHVGEGFEGKKCTKNCLIFVIMAIGSNSAGIRVEMWFAKHFQINSGDVFFYRFVAYDFSHETSTGFSLCVLLQAIECMHLISSTFLRLTRSGVNSETTIQGKSQKTQRAIAFRINGNGIAVGLNDSKRF